MNFAFQVNCRNHILLHTLDKRVVQLERAATTYPSPFVIWFGAIDLFVDVYVVPKIKAGSLEALDMVDIVAGAAPLGV